jgi:hypothetical protein
MFRLCLLAADDGGAGPKKRHPRFHGRRALRFWLDWTPQLADGPEHGPMKKYRPMHGRLRNREGPTNAEKLRMGRGSAQH